MHQRRCGVAGWLPGSIESAALGYPAALAQLRSKRPTRKANMISKVNIFDHGVAWEAGNSVTQGYQVNGTIYISGQFSHDQEAFVDGDIEAQTRLTLENLD